MLTGTICPLPGHVVFPEAHQACSLSVLWAICEPCTEYRPAPLARVPETSPRHSQKPASGLYARPPGPEIFRPITWRSAGDSLLRSTPVPSASLSPPVTAAEPAAFPRIYPESLFRDPPAEPPPYSPPPQNAPRPVVPRRSCATRPRRQASTGWFSRVSHVSPPPQRSIRSNLAPSRENSYPGHPSRSQ